MDTRTGILVGLDRGGFTVGRARHSLAELRGGGVGIERGPPISPPRPLLATHEKFALPRLAKTFFSRSECRPFPFPDAGLWRILNCRVFPVVQKTLYYSMQQQIAGLILCGFFSRQKPFSLCLLSWAPAFIHLSQVLSYLSLFLLSCPLLSKPRNKKKPPKKKTKVDVGVETFWALAGKTVRRLLPSFLPPH